MIPFEGHLLYGWNILFKSEIPTGESKSTVHSANKSKWASRAVNSKHCKNFHYFTQITIYVTAQVSARSGSLGI